MNHCKGCASYTPNSAACCIFYKHNKKGKCPCGLCIIKGMCWVSCQEYVNFEDVVEKYRSVYINKGDDL